MTADDVLEREAIQSQRTESDAVRSELIERRTVEEELDERRRLVYVFEESELLESEIVGSEVLDGEIIDIEEYDRMEAGEMEAGAVGDESTASPESEAGMGPADASPVELSHHDQGKDVVDESGQQIGMVAEVEGQTAYIDPEPGLTDRLKARLDWGGHGDEDYPVEAPQILEITDDEVVIRSE